jgi:hypothetical protein
MRWLMSVDRPTIGQPRGSVPLLADLLTLVPSSATGANLTMLAAWHNAYACTSRCPSADRCRLRNRVIAR